MAKCGGKSGGRARTAASAPRAVQVIFWLVLLVFLAPALLALALRTMAGQPHWSEASHAPTGQAPKPDVCPAAVVQVYAARTWGVRGAIGVHTWIATKRGGADHYRRHEVIGWRLRSRGTAVVQRKGDADAMWFSNAPQLLTDLRGDQMEHVIDKIEQAIERYPYARQYRMWPGPNSNTFVAFVARAVPELRLALPPTAIGKDYLGHAPGSAVDSGETIDPAGTADTAVAKVAMVTDADALGQNRLLRSTFIGAAPSGTGFQISLFGAVGVLAARREGLEVNLLGLVAGFRPWPLALKLPGFGSLPAPAPYRSGHDG